MIYSSKMLILIHHTMCHNLDDHNTNLHCSGIIQHMLHYLFCKELILHKNISHSILQLSIFHTKLQTQTYFPKFHDEKVQYIIYSEIYASAISASTWSVHKSETVKKSGRCHKRLICNRIYLIASGISLYSVTSSH
jgi:hypothetical protein